MALGLIEAAVAETLTDIVAAHIGVEIAEKAPGIAEIDIEAGPEIYEFLFVLVTVSTVAV